MVRMHGWQECHPALVALHSDGEPTERIAEAIERVWGYVSDADRATFHRYMCLRRTDRQHQAVVDSLERQVRAEAGAYSVLELMDEFGLPGVMPDNDTVVREVLALGLGVPLTPVSRADLVTKTGSAEHFLIVVRTRDATDQFDDPRAAAFVARRRVAPCLLCREDCYFDPLSQIAIESAILLCIACTRRRLLDERREAGRI